MLLKIKIPMFVVCALTIGFLSGCGGKQGNAEKALGDVGSGESSTEAQPKQEKKRASPQMTIQGQAGEADITVVYGSPAVKERKIWGGLEAYDKVWRAGANETTSLETTKPIALGGQNIPAGKYGLFIIPKESGDWTIIINTKWSKEEHGAWGAYNYDKAHDVARVDVAPSWGEAVQERLMYAVEGGKLVFAWEKVKLEIPITPAAS